MDRGLRDVEGELGPVEGAAEVRALGERRARRHDGPAGVVGVGLPGEGRPEAEGRLRPGLGVRAAGVAQRDGRRPRRRHVAALAGLELGLDARAVVRRPDGPVASEGAPRAVDVPDVEDVDAADDAARVGRPGPRGDERVRSVLGPEVVAPREGLPARRHELPRPAPPRPPVLAVPPLLPGRHVRARRAERRVEPAPGPPSVGRREDARRDGRPRRRDLDGRRARDARRRDAAAAPPELAPLVPDLEVLDGRRRHAAELDVAVAVAHQRREALLRLVPHLPRRHDDGILEELALAQVRRPVPGRTHVLGHVHDPAGPRRAPAAAPVHGDQTGAGHQGAGFEGGAGPARGPPPPQRPSAPWVGPPPKLQASTGGGSPGERRRREETTCRINESS